MPKGDVELSNHLMMKWCTKASECVVFENICVYVATATPTKHVQPLYPYMGKGIID